MKPRKFNTRALTYIVLVDNREHAAFDSLCPARDYARTLRFKKPYSDDLMAVVVVDTGRFNQAVYNSTIGPF